MNNAYRSHVSRAQADMLAWQEQAIPVTELTIKNAIEWIQQLDRMAESSRTGTMEAIMRAMDDDTVGARHEEVLMVACPSAVWCLCCHHR